MTGHPPTGNDHTLCSPKKGQAFRGPWGAAGQTPLFDELQGQRVVVLLTILNGRSVHVSLSLSRFQGPQEGVLFGAPSFCCMPHGARFADGRANPRHGRR